MAKKKAQTKGVFCLETPMWTDGIKDRSSVEPMLRLLEKLGDYKIPYLYHDVATIQEFDFYLEKWCQKKLDSHPILYLAFHGEPDRLHVGGKEPISLNDLAKRLDSRCTGRVIHFGTCATLWVDDLSLNGFLRRTGALAVCGYTEDVDWLESTAFDLLVLGDLQYVSFQQARYIQKLERTLKEQAPELMKKLGFRIKVRP